jgi:serine/threonine protein phosphatase PrpC
MVLMRSATPGKCPGCDACADPADNFCEVCGRELVPPVVSNAVSAPTACPACKSAQISADGYCEQCGRKASAARDHVEVDLGVIAGVSDRGQVHHRNEDAMALAATETPAGPAALAVVCDGVSTSERPDEASLTAVDTAARALTAALRVGTADQDALTTSVVAADVAVRSLAGRSANAPSATCVACVVTSSAVSVCWVGDSRAYWLPADAADGPAMLTRDDSLAEELIAAGVLSEAEAMASAHGHVITRWLGADAGAPEPHVVRFEPKGPGVVLLCSDGLWNYQADPVALARLTLPRALTNLAAAAADLLTFALDAGGRDNITIVLGRFPPGAAAT